MSTLESRRRMAMMAAAGPQSGFGLDACDSTCQLLVRYGSISRTVVLQARRADTAGSLKNMLASRLQSPGLARYLRLTYNGHDLHDDLPLAAAGLTHGCTLAAACRARGGGGDGGSTGAESRSCYLEMYATRKPDKVNPAEEVLARWTRCRLSGETLRPPVVADGLGALYNKDAVVTALINKTLPPELGHITGLRSLITLQLTPASARRGGGAAGGGPSAGRGGGSGGGGVSNDADFECPVTGQEFNGRFRFVVHRATGVVVSEKAVKDVPAAVAELVGGEAGGPEAWLPVNPTGQELEALREAVAARVAAEKAKKSSKANKKQAAAAAAAAAAGGTAATAADTKKRSNGEGAAGAAAGGAAGGAASKKAKLALAHMPAYANKDVYASLFTSSETAPQKETFLCRNTGAHSRIN